MGKKSKRNRSSSTKQQQQQPSESCVAPALRKSEEEEETKDNLKFEDPYVEEYVVEDDEEEWEDVEDDDDNEKQSSKGAVGDGNMDIIQSWNPLTGEALQPGEKLEMDTSAYKMYHSLTVEWPALSFDFIRDELGESRTRFPHTLIAAIGTQADKPNNNKLTILKISDMAKMHIENDDDILGEEYNPDNNSKGDDSDDDGDDETDDEIDLDPVIEHYSISHYGGVNRVRVMPQRPDIVATWSDTGKVHLFNIESIRQRFNIGKSTNPTSFIDIPTKPFFSYTKHTTEGFAMDWSRVQTGHMVTGDCKGSIHSWVPRPEGGYAVSTFYENNTSDRSVEINPSIEDLQWSPTEGTVFGSAECGGYVRIFDTRASQKYMLSHKIHNNNIDVNVLSWNKLVNNLLATGSDDGILSVFDLRHFSKTKPEPLARFTPHKTPITSVEWHPTDESMLAASDDVGTYIYDLSVEEDDNTNGALDVPPQLLFVHCGSELFKEIHWHPQITSCLMTTALTGFSVFIPSNL